MKGREQVQIKVFTIIMIFCYIFNTFTSYIAGAFSTSLYIGRWGFAFIFAISVSVALSGKYLKEIKLRSWIAVWGLCIVYYLICGIMSDKIKENDYSSCLKYVVIAVGVVVIFYIHKSKLTIDISYIISFLILCMLLINVRDLFKGNICWYFLPYSDAKGFIDASNTQLYLDEITDMNFSRMDTSGVNANESLVIGYNGTHIYSSILNRNIYDFFAEYLNSNGLYSMKHRLNGLDSRSAMEDLLSVRFYNGVGENEVIKNEDKLPLGITFDNYITEDEAKNLSAIEKNALLLNTLILDKDESRLTQTNSIEVEEENYTITFDNIECDGDIFKVDENSVIHISYENKKESERYIYFDKLKVKQAEGAVFAINIYFNDIALRCGMPGYTNGIEESMVCLGDNRKGINTVDITFENNAVIEMSGIHIYGLDKSRLLKENEKRHKGILQNVVISTDMVKGDINTNENTVLFFSIPYSKGWHAKVNNDNVEIIKADYGFCALFLNKGYNKVEMYYESPGKKLGQVVSLTIILILLFLERKVLRKDKG